MILYFSDRPFWLLKNLISFTCFVQCTFGLKILAIFPSNGKSHSVIQLSVAKALATKGHQVDVYSHFPSKTPIPNYTDFSLAGSMPDALNNLTYEEMIVFQDLGVKELTENVAHPTCNLLGLPIFQKLIKNPSKYDVFVTEVKINFCKFL